MAMMKGYTATKNAVVNSNKPKKQTAVALNNVRRSAKAAGKSVGYLAKKC